MFTRSELAITLTKNASAGTGFQTKTASQILIEESRQFTPTRRYTIFLSHSFSDATMVLGLKRALEGMKYSVYVDWIEDPQMDRSRVTKATASHLKQRMLACESLFYVATENSINSKWMPWECGFVDGKIDKVAILPIVETLTSNYCGQEYLSLYPYVSKASQQGASEQKLWIHEDSSTYVLFDRWLKGEKPHKR